MSQNLVSLQLSNEQLALAEQGLDGLRRELSTRWARGRRGEAAPGGEEAAVAVAEG